jgi:hypothetical protein
VEIFMRSFSRLFTLLCVVVSAAVVAPAARAAVYPARSLMPAVQEMQTITKTFNVPDEFQYVLQGYTTENISGFATIQLLDGRVLIIGGTESYDCQDVLVDVYDPATGTVQRTGDLNQARHSMETKLLDDGRVVVWGGYGTSDCPPPELYPEIYDPATGTWTSVPNFTIPTYDTINLGDGRLLVVDGQSVRIVNPANATFTPRSTLTIVRDEPMAVLLQDGTVLIAGGSGSATADVYDPATGWVVPVGDMITDRRRAQVTQLLDGRVLLTGGSDGDVGLKSAEVYDPQTQTFAATGDMRAGGEGHVAALQTNGKVAIVTQMGSGTIEIYDPQTGVFSPTAKDNPNQRTVGIGTSDILLITEASGREVYLLGYIPSTTITGTMTMPRGWITTPTIPVEVTGTSDGTPLKAQLTVYPGDPVPVFALPSGTPVTSTVERNPQYNYAAITLTLYDEWDRQYEVGTGRVSIDVIPPVTEINDLPAFSSPTIALGWDSIEAPSGIAGYDVEVRDGNAGSWTPILTDTRAMTTTFTGEQGHTYFFRVRARDVAGNLEAWPDSPDTRTEVDTLPPAPQFAINSGAFASTSPTVYLHHLGIDEQAPITRVRVRTPEGWSDWRSYSEGYRMTVGASDGRKEVEAQFQDAVGNVSEPYTDTIRLDAAAGTDYEMTINGGARWTNTPTVTLRIGAPGGVSAMRLSNDGGFTDAPWQPFDTRPTWTIEPYGNYTIPRTVYVRVRDRSGNSLGIVQDDIIYDPLAPTGSVAVSNVSALTIAVRLQATDQDNLSGVDRMRVSTDPQFRGAQWQPYATTATVPRADEAVRVYAQFGDRAGNLSAVRSATPTGAADFQVFLPSVQR